MTRRVVGHGPDCYCNPDRLYWPASCRRRAAARVLTATLAARVKENQNG